MTDEKDIFCNNFQVRRRLYHEYANSADYSIPDIVCAFNCGFHEFISEHEKVSILSKLFISLLLCIIKFGSFTQV